MTSSLWAILGAGLLTFASPCVLPLMPVYLATIAGSALDRARPWRTLRVATAFTAGFTLVFVALGALASSVGQWLIAYQRPITWVSAALMIAFGLRSLGILRIAALERDARPALQRVRVASNVAGAFVFGAAFALGWSPCIGPVLASVLTYTATHSASAWRGAGYLAVYAAGMAIPMLLLAAVAPRAMQVIRSVRGMLPLLEKVTGAALLGLGIWTFASVASTPQPSTEQATTCDQAGPGHTCALPDAAQPTAAELADVPEAAPLSEGPHLLEFSSHDCPVCRRMRPVLDRLMSACTEFDGWLVRVDVATANGRALAARHGVRGTPTYVLVNREGIERARLLGEATEAEIAAAIERAFGLSCSS